MGAVWERAWADLGSEGGRERQRNRGRKEGRGGGGEKNKEESLKARSKETGRRS